MFPYTVMEIFLYIFFQEFYSFNLSVRFLMHLNFLMSYFLNIVDHSFTCGSSVALILFVETTIVFSLKCLDTLPKSNDHTWMGLLLDSLLSSIDLYVHL